MNRAVVVDQLSQNPGEKESVAGKVYHFLQNALHSHKQEGGCEDAKNECKVANLWKVEGCMMCLLVPDNNAPIINDEYEKGHTNQDVVATTIPKVVVEMEVSRARQALAA
ncbi:unnamed protein product [Orchesella dallaii]|uniref:Uncharacterized protein n=1 Tax=Orchesella dallaii TaxID=48710 RepID=A0ABP1S9P6_9HEXA